MPPPYHIGVPSAKHGEHHKSISALWELKWKKRASLGIYPFMEGKLQDLEEVFAHFDKNPLKPPYDFVRYAEPFFPVAERLETQAAEAEAHGNMAKASDLYLRAACVYRTARQPAPSCDTQRLAWQRQRIAFYNGAQYLDPPLKEHLIVHTHAKPFTREMYTTIPVSVRIPSNAAPRTKFPTILTIYGLDGHRLEHTMPSTHHIANGWASVAVEIPGTGDCPADPNDPTSPERLWSSVLDWMREQSWIDSNRIAAWGVSCGGYYAMRIAHTHKDVLAGVVAQGGGCHHMFDPEWLEITRFMEYPFDLSQVLATKFGYPDIEAMKLDSRRRFSLLENGILDQPSTRLLCINGMFDELCPIEDSMLPTQHGSIKDARFYPDLKHMGEPVARKDILEWLNKLFKSLEASSPQILNEPYAESALQAIGYGY
ncbi:MAG: hypothetical protein Q9163_003423 [Psora crenata]